eukprot:3090934-Rhodomonas_salina.2
MPSWHLASLVAVAEDLHFAGKFPKTICSHGPLADRGGVPAWERTVTAIYLDDHDAQDGVLVLHVDMQVVHCRGSVIRRRHSRLRVKHARPQNRPSAGGSLDVGSDGLQGRGIRRVTALWA